MLPLYLRLGAVKLIEKWYKIKKISGLLTGLRQIFVVNRVKTEVSAKIRQRGKIR
ncbi:MAG: hypothetical protein RLZZ338_3109 [Cyanobacteriota bacterium]|jgi:hypothetical protein